MLLVSCVAAPQSTQLLQESPRTFSRQSVLLEQIPFHPQELYQCGPAALATVLGASGAEVSPDALVSKVYIPERQGSLQVEMLATARSFDRLVYQLPQRLEAVLSAVDQGFPVLVMQNLGLSWWPQWHYAVVTGFDLGSGELILNSGTIRHYRMSLRVFERTWQRAEHWAVVVQQPGTLPPSAVAPAEYLEAVNTLLANADALNAAGLLEAGMQRWPDSHLLATAMGNHFYRQQDLQGAADYYRRSVQLNPLYAAAHNNLAQVLLELGQTRLAADHAREAVRLGGAYSDSYRETLSRINRAASE